MHIYVSNGNSKMGKVMNLSLPPIKSCIKDVPCKNDCYAMKAYRMYKGTRNAWDSNLKIWEGDKEFYNWESPAEARAFFENSLKAQLRSEKPRFFRWHVGGDIPDARYYLMMMVIAERFPQTKFLAFTKQYNIIAESKNTPPPNLTIVLSAWPGYDMVNPRELPVAWMQDGTETRIPRYTIECPGHCDSCGMCWSLPEIGVDVMFHKH